MLKDRPATSPPPALVEETPSLGDRLLWLCPIIGLVAGVAILWLFGFGLWTGIAFVFLIGCPLLVAWVLVIGRRRGAPARRSP